MDNGFVGVKLYQIINVLNFLLFFSGSTASLGVGLLFGAVLAYGAYQTSQNPSNYLVGLGASALLAGVMGNRYYHSGKFMPAGLIAAVSTAMVLRYVVRSFAIKQQ